MSAAWTLPEVHRRRLTDAADYLAIALVVSLPWSTSATGILAVLWLFALLPTLDIASVRRVIAAPAGGLPLLLVALAALGILWADVAWSARVEGFVSYLKLAVILLLFVQFRRSERGPWAVYAFLAACICLLAASYLVAAFPELLLRRGKDHGVFVKDYISQSGFFTLAAFVLLEFARARWRDGRRALAGVCLVLVALFIANITFVVAARTTFLVIPALILLFGFVRAGWRGGLAACLAGAVLAASAWSASPYLRGRIQSTLTKQVVVGGRVEPSSTTLRLAFWKASFEIVQQAPFIGHGTGSISAMYGRYAATHVNSYVEEATNPHNQTFAVAIQLGLLGTVVLYAMWLFHFLLFRGEGLIAWFGAVVVVQNFVGSLVNSHLFDFTQGWSYAVLVGVAGGMMLRPDSRTVMAMKPAPTASADGAASPPPFGAYAPGMLDRCVMAITTRLPANWLGLRLAIALRRIVTMPLGSGALDVDVWGLRMRLHPRDNICEKLALFTPQMFDRVERAELSAEIARVRGAGNRFVFVDIGANVGLYSMFVAVQAGPQARIVAIEPDPTNFNRFRFNLAANPGLPIHAAALAMGDEAGELVIIPNRSDRGGIRMRKPVVTEAAINEVRVPCRPLLDFLAAEGITAIDALKIDVEGAEPTVLSPFFRDAPETLWPRLILIEDSSEEWPIDLFALLAAKGYVLRTRTRQNVILRRETTAPGAEAVSAAAPI